jgi:hypothetical protein
MSAIPEKPADVLRRASRQSSANTGHPRFRPIKLSVESVFAPLAGQSWGGGIGTRALASIGKPALRPYP